MDMDDEGIEEEQKRDLKKTALDVFDVIEEAIGLGASPSLFWLLVLQNSLGGRGFDGHPQPQQPPETAP